MSQQGQGLSSGSTVGKLRDGRRREPAVRRQIDAPDPAADRPATKDMKSQAAMTEHVLDLPDPLGASYHETEALDEVMA